MPDRELLDLPNEILIEIASHLFAPHALRARRERDLCSFMCCCRDLYILLVCRYHSYRRRSNALEDAVFRNIVPLVELLLDGLPSGSLDIEGVLTPVIGRIRTPLRAAARLGSVELLELLVSHGARVNLPPLDTEMPFAIPTGDGADEVAEKDPREPPLTAAVKAGQLEAARFLIGQGADVNRRIYPGGSSALTEAVSARNIGIVRLLLESAADVHIRCSPGKTVLAQAVRVGDADVVDLLLAHGAGADVNALESSWLRRSLFHEMAEARTAHLAARFVDKLPINYKDSSGISALQLAVFGQTAMFYPKGRMVYRSWVPNANIKHITDMFARVDSYFDEYSDDGDDSLDDDSRDDSSDAGDVDTVSALLDAGAHIGVRIDSDSLKGIPFRSSLVHLAVLRDDKKMVKFLIGRGADLSVVDCERKTCLDRAIELRMPDIARILVDAGCEASVLMKVRAFTVNLKNNPETVDFLLSERRRHDEIDPCAHAWDVVDGEKYFDARDIAQLTSEMRMEQKCTARSLREYMAQFTPNQHNLEADRYPCLVNWKPLPETQVDGFPYFVARQPEHAREWAEYEALEAELVDRMLNNGFLWQQNLQLRKRLAEVMERAGEGLPPGEFLFGRSKMTLKMEPVRHNEDGNILRDHTVELRDFIWPQADDTVVQDAPGASSSNT